MESNKKYDALLSRLRKAVEAYAVENNQTTGQRTEDIVRACTRIMSATLVASVSMIHDEPKNALLNAEAKDLLKNILSLAKLGLDKQAELDWQFAQEQLAKRSTEK